MLQQFQYFPYLVYFEVLLNQQVILYVTVDGFVDAHRTCFCGSYDGNRLLSFIHWIFHPIHALSHITHSKHHHLFCIFSNYLYTDYTFVKRYHLRLYFISMKSPGCWQASDAILYKMTKRSGVSSSSLWLNITIWILDGMHPSSVSRTSFLRSHKYKPR